jgi:diaminopimelate epimerase
MEVIRLIFRKMHGCGNDFVLLSGSDADLTLDWSDMAKRLCARRTNIGADGLVVSVLTSKDPAILEIVCINADGSTATMCGNALRCAAWCAADDYSFQEMSLVMAGVEHQATVRDGEAWVTAEAGAMEPRRVQAVVAGRPTWFDAVHTGTEHVVAVVNDVDSIDAEACGRLVRHHPDLAPLGTNVNFVQRLSPAELKIRTYERGQETETLSCGSGAVASVVIGAMRGLVTAHEEVTVHNRFGTPLTVRPHSERQGKTYWVGGPVTQAYQGEVA